MKKIVFVVGVMVVVTVIGWYFFIKGYHYKITFETDQAPGIVYNTLVGWNNWEPSSKNKVVSTIEKKPFSFLTQQLKVSDSVIKIKWLLERKSDSVTKVSVFLKDDKHDLMQKLKIPFKKTDFVKRSLSTVKKIKEGLEFHNTEYGLSPIDSSLFPERTCAYITLSGKLNEKANLMIAHTIDVMEYLRDNNIKLMDDPFVEVTNWDLKKDSITFDFCFPIKKQNEYPKSSIVNIKTVKSKRALKTIFNGNYRISDRGWYTLLDYAERHHVKIETNPIEVFLNDPHAGEEELKWKAEIYMPIKNNKI